MLVTCYIGGVLGFSLGSAGANLALIDPQWAAPMNTFLLVLLVLATGWNQRRLAKELERTKGRVETVNEIAQEERAEIAKNVVDVKRIVTPESNRDPNARTRANDGTPRPRTRTEDPPPWR